MAERTGPGRPNSTYDDIVQNVLKKRCENSILHCKVLKNFVLLPRELKLKKEMAISSENIKSQMRKGFLEYCIMLIISKKPAYVSDLISELKEAQLIVVEGTLYPLLSRLKNGGLLSYQWQESLQGPPRKYYELTEAGVQFLAELNDAWTELAGAINIIKNSDNQ